MHERLDAGLTVVSIILILLGNYTRNAFVVVLGVFLLFWGYPSTRIFSRPTEVEP